MTSSQGQLAGHKIQYGWEAKRSEVDLYAIIDQYTHGGGDYGVAFKFMRQTCGLKEKTGDQGDSGELGDLDDGCVKGHGVHVNSHHPHACFAR